MKNLKILVAFALFAAFTPLLFGQNPYHANPTNYLQVSEAIWQDIQPLGSVDITTVEDHVEDVVTAYPYNPFDAPPTLVLDEFTDDKIKVSWLLDPNADSYEIRFLNLNDRSSLVRNTSASFVEYLNPTEGIYLVSIVKKDLYGIVLEQTFAELIIITKTIMQFTIPTSTDCNCNPDWSTEHIDVPRAVAEAYTLPNFKKMTEIHGNSKYQITIELEGLGDRVIYVTRSTSNGTQFELNCYSDLNLEYWQHPEYGNGPLIPVLVLEDYSGNYFPVTYLDNLFGQSRWKFHNYVTTSNEISSVKYVKCNYTPPPSNRLSSSEEPQSSSPIDILPNPATNHVQINSWSDNLGTLSITNQLGQVIHTKELALSSEQIDIEEWPKGVYYVAMKLKGETFTKSFVKIN